MSILKVVCHCGHTPKGAHENYIVAPYEAGDCVWDETRIRERTQIISEDVINIWGIH